MKRPLVLVVLATLLPAAMLGQATPPQSADFRYSPQRYFAAICFPDDWQKSVVTERGGLGYDFAPGPYATPLTEVWLDADDVDLSLKRQWLPDPRVPIAATEFTGPSTTLRVDAFSLVPDDIRFEPPVIEGGRVRRLLGLTGTLGWAFPRGIVDPAFENVAWGTNRPIMYRVKVTPGSKKIVAIGICEPYKWGPNTRTLVLRVEGDEPKNVDPMASGEKNIPCVLLFNAADADGDGEIAVESHADLQSPDANTILNAFWVFPEGASVTASQILSGELSSQAELSYSCGPEAEVYASSPRADGLLGVFTGSELTPVIAIRTQRSVSMDTVSGVVSLDGRPFLLSRPVGSSIARREDLWFVRLPRGTDTVEVIALHGARTPQQLTLLPHLPEARSEAVDHWRTRADLPFGRIIVPDNTLQYLLDANIRNLYQIRERVDGFLQFQPGPSVYRGLWVHDAIWHIQAALALGDTQSAWHMLEGILRFQRPDGHLKVIEPWTMIRETPILVYLLCSVARFTNDRAWLLTQWDRIQRALEWLRGQRLSTMTDPTLTSYGLFPAGFADGGLGGMAPEYASVYWSLIGLKKAIASAQWIGKENDAAAWQQFYDELYASFRNAARRDRRRDTAGNIYLPLSVADTALSRPPQQAQWALLEAQVHGDILLQRDSLVVGTLAMLDAGSAQGLPLNTGWLKDGVWPFFAGFFGLAHRSQGNVSRAWDVLYAYANHANPLGTWVEEQLPKAVGAKTAGDGSNASASALYIVLLKGLLAFERGNTLELLAGLPEHWLFPRSELHLNSVRTGCGEVTLSMQMSPDGRTGSITVEPIRGNDSKGGPVLFLQFLKKAGFVDERGSELRDRLYGSWGRKITVKFRRND